MSLKLASKIVTTLRLEFKELVRMSENKYFNNLASLCCEN